MKRFLLLLLLAVTCGAQAQQMTADEQSEAIRRLTEEVQSLRTKQSAWEKIKSALPTFSGYAQIRYSYGTDLSEFKMRRVRLSMAGSVTPKIDYRVQVELAGFKLLDAYVDYKPFDQLKIKAGQFRIPFSIENTECVPTTMEMLEFPLALQKLMGFSEQIGSEVIRAAGRDTGIALRGDLFGRILSYDLGVFNGTGVCTGENNKSKDISARLLLRPVRGLTIAGSYSRGEFGSAFYERQRTCVGACYDRGAVVARAEYFIGTTGIEGSGEVDSDGCYALLGWRFSPRWLAAVRYDSFTADIDARELTTQSDYTAGLSWMPVKRLRLQAEYLYTDYSVTHAHGARIQLTASF